MPAAGMTRGTLGGPYCAVTDGAAAGCTSAGAIAGGGQQSKTGGPSTPCLSLTPLLTEFHDLGMVNEVSWAYASALYPIFRNRLCWKGVGCAAGGRTHCKAATFALLERQGLANACAGRWDRLGQEPGQPPLTEFRGQGAARDASALQGTLIAPYCAVTDGGPLRAAQSRGP